MKSVPFLCGALLFSIALILQSAPENPYSAIADRNVFGLVPVTVAPPISKPTTPPPKITPNGIMTLFGKLQALFKVDNKPTPGHPAKDESYILGVGERQDDIEVTKIDKDAGVITFNNHGEIQELPLTDAPNVTTTAGALPKPSPFLNHHIPIPSPSHSLPPIRTSMSRNGSVALGGANTASPGAVMSGGTSTTSSTATKSQRLSPEAQAIAIEAQRIKYEKEGNPIAKILPPTPLTKEVQKEVNGPPPAP